jgi:hypothetical protein
MMKQLNLTFTLFNEEAQGVGDALGMTDEQLAEDFGILMEASLHAQEKGKAENIGEIMDVLTSFDFFPQFLMYSGLSHFAATMNSVLVAGEIKHEGGEDE